MVTDWFHLLLGFHEEGCTPTAVRKQLKVENGKLRSQASSAEYSIGEFRTQSLGRLREAARRQIQDPKVVQAAGLRGPLRVEHSFNDAAELHRRAENRLALFQVASQTNCLPLVSPTSTPEMGITGYIDDRTQGPCCAIACGAGTVYRNYFAPVPTNGGAEQVGQSEDRQLDCLEGLCHELGNANHRYFEVRGGFTLARDAGLQDLNAKLAGLDEEGLDNLRSRLRVGVHEDVEVTSYHWGCNLLRDPEQLVTQVFTSVCSVAHSGNEPALWQPLARLTLEASYEAALWAAVLSAIRHKGAQGSLRVYLTTVGRCLLGHGAAWIAEAVQRAIQRVCVDNGLGLQVFLVAYKEPAGQELADVVEHFSSGMLWVRIPSYSSGEGPEPCGRGSKNASKDLSGVRNVSKETFHRWEQKVIKAFFSREDKSADVMPVEGNPRVVTKDSLGVLAYEQSIEAVDADDVPSMVAAGMRAALPPKRKLNLWHAGKQAPDCVAYGCDGELFRYPVCEAGGCGTALQPMSTVLPLEGERFAMAPGCDLLALSGDMCAQWRELAGKRLPGSLEADLVRWLQSLSQEFDGHVVMRFCRMPPERRVVVTADDVIRSTGAYYVCDRRGPRQVFEGNGLICAVSRRRANTDYSPEVLDLECRPTSPAGLSLGNDNVRWRDICRAAVNDKTMLAKVTGNERYRLNGITRAVRDKVTRKRSSEVSADHGGLKIPLVLESPATSTSPPLRALEPQRTPQVPPLESLSDGTQPEAAAPQRKPPQLQRARSGTSGSTSPPQSPSGSLAEVPRSPSSKDTPTRASRENSPSLLMMINHAPSKESLGRRATTFSKSGLPEREQHQFLDICRNGDFERVKEYLTVNPFYINVQPDGRWSALHQFAYHGDSEAIQYLLDKLADPSAKTTEGHTPAEVAQDRVAALLGKRGEAARARTSTSLQMVGLLCTPCSVKKTPVRPPNA